MTNYNPYQPPAETSTLLPAAPIELQSQGIGGWLILVGIGIVLSPFTMFTQTIAFIKSVYTSGTWEAMTAQGSADYHPMWAPILVTETGFNVIQCALWSYMVYLFFAKKKTFPKWYIWAQASLFVFLIADALAIYLIRPDLPVFTPEASKELGRSLVAVCVWVPYMLVSRRVAATFTR
jgi:hypothetical protein